MYYLHRHSLRHPDLSIGALRSFLNSHYDAQVREIHLIPVRDVDGLLDAISGLTAIRPTNKESAP